MAFQIHPYAFALAISAVVTLSVSIAILRRETPGSAQLGGLLLNLFVWSGSYTLIWFLRDFNDKILWLKIMYLGIIAAPTMLLSFTLQVTHQGYRLPPRIILLLLIEPLIVFFTVWYRIEWMFPRIWVEEKNTFAFLQMEQGTFFWINTTYSITLVLLGLLALAQAWQRANPFFRKQYSVIIMASSIPLVANLFSQAHTAELNNLDLTPFSFSIAGVIYMYAIARYPFMDVLPIARGRLIESMSDGVLVLDQQGRILDVNPAMANFTEIAPGALIGQNVSDVLGNWSNNVETILTGIETRTEMKNPHQANHYLDLRITPLYDEQQQPLGRLIVFRDVTARKKVERDLRQANDRLQTQLIEIGILQSQLREQAIRDALTNVFNRRYLEDTLERELSRANRENYPLCVLMMDLDYFKEINDTYGHEAGDESLKALANLIVHHSRQGDFVCRYGGEEFVLVMPNITIQIAQQRAHDLHQEIRQMPVLYGVFNLSVTVSMGVAMYPQHGNTKNDLLRAADRAMYIAKNTGRDRVVMYEEEQLNTG